MGRTLQTSWQSPLSLNLTLMRVTGMWPYARIGAGAALRLGQTIYFWFTVLCNFSFLAAKGTYTASVAGKNLTLFTESLCDVLCISYSLTQLVVMVWMRRSLQSLVVQVEQSTGLLHAVIPVQVHREVLVSAAKDCRRLTAYIVNAFGFAASSFLLYAYTAGKKDVQVLPIKISTPFEQDKSPAREILLPLELIGVVVTVSGCGALSALFISLIVLVTGQARVVQRAFEARKQADPLEKGAGAKFSGMKGLVRTVRLHQNVMDLSAKLSRVLGPFYGCQLANTTLMVCLSAFQVSTGPFYNRNLRYYLLAAAVLTQVFLVCLYATELSDQGAAVQRSVETGNWIIGSPRTRRVAKFVIMRAQKPPTIRIGGYLSIGLPTFLELLRSSYSFFAFLQKRRGAGTDEE